MLDPMKKMPPQEPKKKKPTQAPMKETMAKQRHAPRKGTSHINMQSSPTHQVLVTIVLKLNVCNGEWVEIPCPKGKSQTDSKGIKTQERFKILHTMIDLNYTYVQFSNEFKNIFKRVINRYIQYKFNFNNFTTLIEKFYWILTSVDSFKFLVNTYVNWGKFFKKKIIMLETSYNE